MKGTFDMSTGVGKQNETTKQCLLQLVVFHQNQDTSGCFQCFFNTWKQLGSGTCISILQQCLFTSWGATDSSATSLSQSA